MMVVIIEPMALVVEIFLAVPKLVQGGLLHFLGDHRAAGLDEQQSQEAWKLQSGGNADDQSVVPMCVDCSMGMPGR